MKIKKIFICIFLFVMLLSVNENVFATSFTCEALGSNAVIDYQLAKIVRYVILLIQIAVPVLLVVLGTIDLLKGIAAQKEDEMASGRKVFVKRLIAGVLVFFVIAIVKLVISVAANGDSHNIMTCVNCFIEPQDPNNMNC